MPKGGSTITIGPLLEKAGVIASASDFISYVKLQNVEDCLQTGKFSLSPSMNGKKILDILCDTPLPTEIPFIVKAGDRIRDIDDALTAQSLIKDGEYQKRVTEPSQFTVVFPLPSNSLEGYLYPGTYMLIPGHFMVKALIQINWTPFMKNTTSQRKSLL